MLKRNVRAKLNIVKLLAAILSVSLTVTGCEIPQIFGDESSGSETVEEKVTSSGESVAVDRTLLEPVGVPDNFEKVEYRDICDAEVFTCEVIPETTEYFYPDDQTFKGYGAYPGKSVTDGDILVYGDTDELDEKIEEETKSLREFEDSTSIEILDLTDDLTDALEAEYDTACAASSYSNAIILDESGNYAPKDPQVTKSLDSAQKNAALNRQRVEESIYEKNELFAIEYDYRKGKIGRLQDKKSKLLLESKEEGCVVALNYFLEGDRITRRTPIAALGNLSHKQLRTEYIKQYVMDKAADYYAIIGGNRYEVNYQPMEEIEYNQLIKNGDTPYSTFEIVGDTEEVKIGDFAAVVIVKARASHVPAVSRDSITIDGDKAYVDVKDGESTRRTEIKLGVKDGGYQEVIDGLEIGDLVLTDSAVTSGKSGQTLEKGESYTQYKSNGFLFYPFAEYLSNPVKKGTSYIKEICVSNNQMIQEGDTIFTIEVVPDEIGIARLTKQIERQNNRLARLYQIREEDKVKAEKAALCNERYTNRANDKEIRAKEASIKSLTEELEQYSKFGELVEIKAPYNGIVLDVGEWKPGDRIPYKEKIIEIADNKLGYVIVKDEDAMLSYGKKAEVSFKTDGVKEESFSGTVVTVSNIALSSKMKQSEALIAVDEDSLLTAAGSMQSADGGWARNTYQVILKARYMPNVVLVPKKAVEDIDGTKYVHVIDADGSVSRKAFLPGGSDQENYWVAEGLSEGEKICW